MKIAFIYAYRPDEIWSTPLSLATEFQNRGHEVNIYSTISSTGNFTEAGIKMLLDECNAGKAPDIIIYMDWGRFDSPLLDKSLYPKAYWVTEMGDEIQNFQRNFPRSNRFDICLTPDYRCEKMYKDAGRNAIFFSHWADTCIHYPMNIPDKYDAVSTRGHGSSNILDWLSSDLGDKFHNKAGYDGIKHSEALQEGKLVVQHSRHGEITRRIFEAMACGKMVLTDRLDLTTHLQDLFEEGKEIIFYDDYWDCHEKIQYYASHDEARERIAHAGQDKVLKEHTQYQRVNTILEHYKKWKNSQ